MRSKIVLAIFSIILMVGGLGCVALSHLATPGDIDKKAVRYAVDAGVADANDYKGYGNLAKASKLVKDVDSAHILNRQELEQAMQREDTQYSIHTNSVVDNERNAIRREETIFGEKGILSMGMTMLGVGGFSGLLGLTRKRPGDITKEEAQNAIAEATGRTAEELSKKEKQLIQVVKGVQSFMDTNRDADDMLSSLKDILSKHQDEDTRKAVAVVKTNV
jgi:hypothetical protein